MREIGPFACNLWFFETTQFSELDDVKIGPMVRAMKLSYGRNSSARDGVDFTRVNGWALESYMRLVIGGNFSYRVVSDLGVSASVI